MIELRDVSVRIRNRAILESITLDIHPGDFWLIFGPNGAGKTTLFNVITGLIEAGRGSVRVAGKDLKNHSRRSLAREISHLAQFDEFNLPVSVRDVLLAGRFPYASWWRGYSPSDGERLEAAAREMDLLNFLERDINTLSGGERKKVMLASAFIQDVSTILLDEPHTFLDPRSAYLLNENMRQMHRNGKTMVVISHRIDLLHPLATKMAALRDGRLLYAGEKILDPELFEKTFGIANGNWFRTHPERMRGGGERA